MFRSKLLACFLIIVAFTAKAQPGEQLVKVVIAPDRDNWTYKVGEKVTFNVSFHAGTR